MVAIRYLTVGGLTFAFYLAVLALFHDMLRLPHLLAVGLAYVLAVAVHFFTNRSFTFAAQDGAVTAQGVRYLGLVVLNSALQLAVVYLLHDLARWNLYVAAALGIGVTLATGFVLMRGWVFARNSRQ